MRFIPGIQVGLIFKINECQYCILIEQKWKSHNHLKRWEKSFDKIQYIFKIKGTIESKIGIKRNFLNLMKAIHTIYKSNVVLKGKRLNAFSQNQDQDKDVSLTLH